MRKIIQADALQWLRSVKSLPHVVTGICDADEMDNVSFEEYLTFFQDVAYEILSKVQGYAIFIQTDRKYNGEWIDKSYLLQTAAERAGCVLRWHRIVLRREPESIHLQRPTYSHMMCFSHVDSRLGPGKQWADVIKGGDALYKNGTPLLAAERAVQFIAETKSDFETIIDPFVGYGTIVALAEKFGLNAVGIDIDAEQCQRARELTL